jgi:hypothetical protein
VPLLLYEQAKNVCFGKIVVILVRKLAPQVPPTLSMRRLFGCAWLVPSWFFCSEYDTRFNQTAPLSCTDIVTDLTHFWVQFQAVLTCHSAWFAGPQAFGHTQQPLRGSTSTLSTCRQPSQASTSPTDPHSPRSHSPLLSPLYKSSCTAKQSVLACAAGQRCVQLIIADTAAACGTSPSAHSG